MIETTQKYKIHELGALHLLPEIEDKSVDLILTDLPYGTTACRWDTIIPFEPMWEQYKRIIKDNGAIVLTASQPFTSALIMSNIDMFKYEFIWDKVAPSSGFGANSRPLKKHENVCIFYNTQPTYNPIMEKGIKWKRGGNRRQAGYTGVTDVLCERKGDTTELKYPKSIITISNANKNGIVHPTQKPIPLAEYLIKTYTNEGDTVHDSCMGSGWSLHACRNLNRNYIGFDISDEWEYNYKIDDCKLNIWMQTMLCRND